MTRLAAIGLGLIVLILIVTVYISMLGCPTGSVEVAGDFFSSGRCFTVIDGQVHSEVPGL